MTDTATAPQDTAPQPEPEVSTDQWAVVEVMGHRFHAGKVTEQTIAGAGFLKVDSLTVTSEGEERWETTFYAPHALFSIRPGSEESVRARAPRVFGGASALALDRGLYPIDDDDDDEDFDRGDYD